MWTSESSELLKLKLSATAVVGVGLATIVVCGLVSVRGSTAAAIREKEEYRRSPGCVRTPASVDASLTPCREIAATVIYRSRTVDDPRSTNDPWWLPGYASGQHSPNHNTLVLRDPAGSSRSVAEIPDSFWDAMVIDESISAQIWKDGRITRLTGNGLDADTAESAGAIGTKRLQDRLALLTFLASLCVALLAGLWGLWGRRSGL
jgi:hypothetical protein